MIKLKSIFRNEKEQLKEVTYTIEDLRHELIAKEAIDLIPRMLAEEWIKENKEKVFFHIDPKVVTDYVTAKITTILMERFAK